MLPTYEMIVTRRRTRWAFLLNIILRLYGRATGLNIYILGSGIGAGQMDLNIIPDYKQPPK